jgi:hypothetical protein
MVGLVVLSLLPLLLTGPAAAVIYITLLKWGRRRMVWIFWPFLIATTILLGILIGHTFSDFFPGPGCFTTLFTPAAAILTLLVFRLQVKRFDQAIGHDSHRRRWFQSAMLLLPALQLSAPVIGLGYARSCDLLNRQAAQPILVALDRYHQEHDRYPSLPGRHQSDLGFLVPQYLDVLPPRACRAPFDRLDSYPVDDDWSLYFCTTSPGQETLLLVPVVGTDSQQIYNPETKRWSRGNSFDGLCP